MGILENIKEYFTSETSRNKNAALVAGILFFSGWWILIDAMSLDKKYEITAGMVFIGIFGTISFFMVNTVSNARISDENPSDTGRRIAQIWLLIGFVSGFAAVIAAVWVMVNNFINNPEKTNWLGVSLLVSNVFILVGNLIYKFGRNEEDWME